MMLTLKLLELRCKRSRTNFAPEQTNMEALSRGCHFVVVVSGGFPSPPVRSYSGAHPVDRAVKGEPWKEVLRSAT